MEAVVIRRPWILDPPVAADDPMVGVADARVRRDPVHDALKTEDSDRRRLVALVPVGGEAVPAEMRRPRPAGRAPAVAALPPEAQRADGRARRRADDGHELRRPLQVELSREVSGARGALTAAAARRGGEDEQERGAD